MTGLSSTASGAQAAAHTGTVPVALVCMLLAATAQVGYALLGALFGVPAMLTGYLLRSFPAVIVGAIIGAGPMLVAVRWAFQRGGARNRMGGMLSSVAGSTGVMRK